MVFAAPAPANHGALDTSFGGSGTVVTSDTTSAVSVAGMVIQGDGKIIVAGTKNPPDGSSLPMVARYLPSGVLDGTYGNGGISTRGAAAPGGTVAGVDDIALVAGGKLVIVGRSLLADGTRVTFIERLHPNGDIDTTFGQGGSVLHAFPVEPGGNQEWKAVSFDPAVRGTGYKLVVGGVAGSQGVVARFQSDGDFEASVMLPYEHPGGGTLQDVALVGPRSGFGRNIFAAAADSTSQAHYFFSVTRLDGAGGFALDTNFGTGGTAKVFLPRTLTNGTHQDPKGAEVAALGVRADGAVDVGGSLQLPQRRRPLRLRALSYEWDPEHGHATAGRWPHAPSTTPPTRGIAPATCSSTPTGARSSGAGSGRGSA